MNRHKYFVKINGSRYKTPGKYAIVVHGVVKMQMLGFLGKKQRFWKDLLVTTGILISAIMLNELLFFLELELQNLIVIYILSILIIARFTDGYFFGVLSAFIGTFVFDFLLTDPRMAFSFTIGFPITLLIMLSVSVVSCAITTQMKNSFAQRQSIKIVAEKEKMRSMLLRAISHDLRTPLTGILSAGSIIEEQAGSLDPADIQDIASNIKNDSEWLIRMVENLLAVTRITDGAVKVKKTMEVAEETMAQAASIVRKRFPDCMIHVESYEEPLLLPMDAVLISQVFINLLENAARNSPQASQIEFGLYKDEGFARFEVVDHGNGVPAQIINTLFDASVAAREQSSDSASGIGIGLSICKTIVDAHDGKITGGNKPEGGAIFRVMLPLS